MSAEVKNRYKSYIRAKYEDFAETEFLTMSDSTQLRILRTYAPENTISAIKKLITFLIIVTLTPKYSFSTG